MCMTSKRNRKSARKELWRSVEVLLRGATKQTRGAWWIGGDGVRLCSWQQKGQYNRWSRQGGRRRRRRRMAACEMVTKIVPVQLIVNENFVRALAKLMESMWVFSLENVCWCLEWFLLRRITEVSFDFLLFWWRYFFEKFVKNSGLP